jgi:multidrug efflux pump subunit AcrA (membrane-fusion protein)
MGDHAENEPGEVIGAIVCEQIDDSTPSPVLGDRAELLSSHAARALANSDDYHSLFLLPLWRMLGRSRVLVAARHLPKTITAAIATLLLLLAALVVRIDFAPEGSGVLQPVERRDIFAGADGVVTEVHVNHGDQVAEGAPLVTLRNTDLLVQLENIAGQRQSTLERLLDTQRRLLENAVASPDERTRLAGELLQLRRQKESLDTQYELLQAKQAELVVRSPIAGQVITWDTKKLLMNRPVSPGQVLLTIADPRGDWELIVQMPEDNMGHIQAALKQLGQDLDASYVLATDPGRKLHGQVKAIHQLSELHPTEGQTVKIDVAIDESDLIDPRPGATATAQVHCGKRSIAFVWLHDVLEFLQAKVFF